MPYAPVPAAPTCPCSICARASTSASTSEPTTAHPDDHSFSTVAPAWPNTDWSDSDDRIDEEPSPYVPPTPEDIAQLRFTLERTLSAPLRLSREAAADREKEREKALKKKMEEEEEQRVKSMFCCAICLEMEFPDESTTIEGCGHQFGTQCLKNMIRSKLEERRFPMLCPTCAIGSGLASSTVITSDLARKVGLTNDEVERFIELEELQVYVALFCPDCDKRVLVDREKFLFQKGTKKIGCPTSGCTHQWCRGCQQTVRKGQKHACDGLAELKRMVKSYGWKYCPGCKTPVDKFTGCNHVTCTAPGCNTHFCYRCGKVIVRSVHGNDIHRATQAHFRSALFFWRCSQFHDPNFLVRFITRRRAPLP